MEKREFCAKLIKLLYEVEPAGGNLHIVLDDLNVENEHLLFCAKQLEGKHQEKTDKGEYQVYLEMAITMYLCDMPVEERAEFIQKAKREESFTDRDASNLIHELRFGAKHGCDYDLLERAADCIEGITAAVANRDMLANDLYRYIDKIEEKEPKQEDVVTELLARCDEAAVLGTIITRRDGADRAVIRIGTEPRRLIVDRDFGWGWYNSEGPEE